MVELPGKRIVVFGRTKRTWIYDIEKDVWSDQLEGQGSLPLMNTNYRVDAAGCLLGTYVYCIGGTDNHEALIPYIERFQD